MTPQVGRILLELDGKPHIAVGFVTGEQQVRGAHHLTPVGLLSWGHQVQFIILILRRRVRPWWTRGRTNEVQTIPYLRVEYVAPLISKPVELEKERWSLSDTQMRNDRFHGNWDWQLDICLRVRAYETSRHVWCWNCPLCSYIFYSKCKHTCPLVQESVWEGICMVLLANVMKMSICGDNVLPSILKPETAKTVGMSQWQTCMTFLCEKQKKIFWRILLTKQFWLSLMSIVWTKTFRQFSKYLLCSTE